MSELEKPDYTEYVSPVGPEKKDYSVNGICRALFSEEKGCTRFDGYGQLCTRKCAWSGRCIDPVDKVVGMFEGAE
jgi:hypothetical protein